MIQYPKHRAILVDLCWATSLQ